MKHKLFKDHRLIWSGIFAIHGMLLLKDIGYIAVTLRPRELEKIIESKQYELEELEIQAEEGDKLGIIPIHIFDGKILNSINQEIVFIEIK